MIQTRKIVTILSLALFLFTLGCNSHKSESLVLNNGNKWEANPETTTGVNNMIRIVNSFSDAENSEAYITLKSELESEFTYIFKNCTMKGEGHDQLHNFLIPLKGMFDGLESTDLNMQKSNVRYLQEHLKLYSKYFI